MFIKSLSTLLFTQDGEISWKCQRGKPRIRPKWLNKPHIQHKIIHTIRLFGSFTCIQWGAECDNVVGGRGTHQCGTPIFVRVSKRAWASGLEKPRVQRPPIVGRLAGFNIEQLAGEFIPASDHTFLAISTLHAEHLRARAVQVRQAPGSAACTCTACPFGHDEHWEVEPVDHAHVVEVHPCRDV